MPCSGRAMPLWSIALFLLYWVTFAATMAYALRRGGRPERAGAIIIMAGSLLTVLVMSTAPHSSVQQAALLGRAVFAIDVAILAALVILALTSKRFWPLWVVGFHLNGVMAHLAHVLDWTLLPHAYVLMQPFWIYPMFVALALGTRGRQRSIEGSASIA